MALINNDTWKLIPCNYDKNLLECKCIYRIKYNSNGSVEQFKARIVVFGNHHQCDSCDTSMLTLKFHGHLFNLLLYVDDILLTVSSTELVTKFIVVLSSQFAIKDLGALHYFLGVQAVRTPSGLFLPQNKYISYLLRKFHLHTVKPVRTPVVSRVTLFILDGDLLLDPTYYRSLVGSLQYLTMTRPNVAYAVNMVSQFIYMLLVLLTFMLYMKRIFRYLQGTLDFDLVLLSSTSSTVVIAYSDADWAGCPHTRRSTNGYVVFLGKNLISWHSNNQPIVSKTSTEADYRTVAYTATRTIWLRQLLANIDHFSFDDM
ncbi:uncharacterized mitochondrial protein AtMg00810-like [Beta vulgaris subsp. vulgaris]|uniref:uncharacterized mitochondrial protein AtMg00810-like n=1 Tax=Beta vulgaris subsp. vulgaris TaxID=3555 RepID=UPI0020376324|nr:uncharacterized mitochondrial protein AtMg00810-like [Beta vulgaris subsp. vulgaris]